MGLSPSVAGWSVTAQATKSPVVVFSRTDRAAARGARAPLPLAHSRFYRGGGQISRKLAAPAEPRPSDTPRAKRWAWRSASKAHRALRRASGCAIRPGRHALCRASQGFFSGGGPWDSETEETKGR